MCAMTSRCEPGRPQSMYSFMLYDSHVCAVQIRVMAVRVMKLHQTTGIAPSFLVLVQDGGECSVLCAILLYSWEVG